MLSAFIYRYDLLPGKALMFVFNYVIGERPVVHFYGGDTKE